MMIEATIRQERGKGAARRLRRAGMVPAVLYGGGSETTPLTVDSHRARLILRTAGYTVVHELKVEGGEDTRAILKDWLLDPIRGDILHIDLQRVAMDVQIRVRVPVHTFGEPHGVKVQGGIFERVGRDVEVECLPGDIPEEIRIDVSGFTIGQQLRAADLPLDDSKVRLLTEPQRVLAHVIAPTKEEAAPTAEVAAAVVPEAAEPAEPEVIKRVRKEAEEEEKGEKKGK